MHLRDSQLHGDLALRQAVEEPEVQDLALALVERAEAGCEHRPVFGRLVARLLVAQQIDALEVGCLVAVERRRQRAGRVGTPDLQRLDDVFLVDLCRLCELRDRR